MFSLLPTVFLRWVQSIVKPRVERWARIRDAQLDLDERELEERRSFLAIAAEKKTKAVR
jgi:hypothetical protein